jgi:hypothetical protein
VERPPTGAEWPLDNLQSGEDYPDACEPRRALLGGLFSGALTGRCGFRALHGCATFGGMMVYGAINWGLVIVIIVIVLAVIGLLSLLGFRRRGR